MSEEIRFAGQGGDEIRAELFRPAGSASDTPAVIVVHEVFGLDAFTRSVAQRLADAGYTALAPDLYSRSGVPGPESTASDPAPAWEIETIRAAVASLPDRRTAADLEAAANWLAADDAVDSQSIAVLGFCAGGNQAFLMACQSRRVAAVVVYYGRMVYPDLSAAKPVQPLEMALNLSAPLLAFFGQLDPSIPVEDVDAMERTLAQFSKESDVVRMPGVGHGFANALRPGWDEAAAGVAWERTLGFLAESLGLSDG
ncbi:MAG: carboxymethylenebutenolidase [Planctomycetota bacterium]